jgi:thiamine-monophosphate kinase
MNLSERQFVDRLRRRAQRAARSPHLGKKTLLKVRTGIGDDAAVISWNDRSDLLVTTDLLLEDVHFRHEWQPAASIGHKTLARGLSDIAAMGGDARLAFLSLAIPESTPGAWVDDFFRGLLALAQRHRVILAGGDTAASRSGILADVTVIGEVPAGRAVLRSGARVGDTIWVSGTLGGAARALQTLLRQGRNQKPTTVGRRNADRSTPRRDALLRPLLYPQPRLALGAALREYGLVSSMMDLSDGLSIDLARLCEASGVGALIEQAAVPHAGGVSMDHALHGGEDFELLFTVPARKSHRVPDRIGGVPVTRIGTIVRRRQRTTLRIVCDGKERQLPIRGFQHFH